MVEIVCLYVLCWRAALELVRFVKLGGWQAMSFSLFHFFTVGWMGVMGGVLGAGCWTVGDGATSDGAMSDGLQVMCILILYY